MKQETTTEIIGWIISMICWVCFLIVAVLCLSCASTPVTTTQPTEINTTHQIIMKTISSTDWLLSMLLLGSVAGIFAGLNGIKSGWIAVLSCIGGMVLKASLTSTWVYWCCGFLFVGSILVATASVLWKNKAIKELIMSAQYLKQAVPDKERVKEIFNLTQTKDTKALVTSVKNNLKLNGTIQ